MLESCSCRPKSLEACCQGGNLDEWEEERGAVGQEERAQTAVGSISTHKAKNGINLQQLQQSLPIQNWTIQPQQALQLNHRLNLGADSIVSWYRRMVTTKKK